MNGLDYKCGLGERLCVGVGSPLGVGCRANLGGLDLGVTSPSVHRSRFSTARLESVVCRGLRFRPMTANYHMQNIMQNLISSAPNFTNLIQAYEYVALKRARVTYFNTGIHNLGT